MMSEKAREWTLQYDSNFDSDLPLVCDGPHIDATEQEVRVVEYSAYNQAIYELDKSRADHTRKIAELEAKAEKYRKALEEIRDYVDKDPANAHPADCALIARQALEDVE